MSHWKGDFKGFYKAGIRNAATVASDEVDDLLAEFEKNANDSKKVKKFARVLKKRLSAGNIKEECPPYDYTNTKGYKYY